MIQFDINLEFAIFSKVYEEKLNLLKQDLLKRKQTLKWVYERDNLTAEQLKKANAEEEHIGLVVDYIRNTENLFQVVLNVLVDKRQDQINWHNEWKREVEKNLEFTQFMITKFAKPKTNATEKGN